MKFLITLHRIIEGGVGYDGYGYPWHCITKSYYNKIKLIVKQ